MKCIAIVVMVVLATVSADPYTELRYETPYSHIGYKTVPRYVTEEKKFFLTPKYYEPKYEDKTRFVYVEPKYEENYYKTELKYEEPKFEKFYKPELKYVAKSGNFFDGRKFEDEYFKTEPKYVAKSGNFYKERKYDDGSYKPKFEEQKGAVHIVE